MRELPYRLATMLLPSMLVVSMLTTQLHWALVSHVTCPKHGELIHGDNYGAAVVPSDSTLALQSVPEPTDHGHDHCLVPTQRRDALLAVAQQSTPAPAAWLSNDLPPCATCRQSIPLLLSAPKNSPPAHLT